MSIELDCQSNVTITEIVKEERTYRSEIITTKGRDYFFVANREIVTTHDGEVVEIDRKTPQVPQLRVNMNDIVSGDDIVNYKDKTGADKSIPAADIPFIIPTYIETLISAEKTRLNNE